jgi:MerR family copper efflux transcriptional regulator
MTIQQAARATRWSPRMLRYIERAGLLAPARSPAGYREYDAAELKRLRTLRELLMTFDIELSDVAFAVRMEADPGLRRAIREWLEPPIRTTSCARLAIPRITTQLETR